MMCLIEGCNHLKSRRMRIKKGDGVNPWDNWQICPCCAVTLTEIGVIEYDAYHSVPIKCLNYIKAEIAISTWKPGPIRQVQKNKTKRRKEFIARMGY